VSAVIASDLRERLRAHFGFRRFRPGQAEAIESALRGRDVVVVMPTGSGKSICYQLPALELEGVTVVVSPLLSLMKDQADSLTNRGISVVEINGTLTPARRRELEAEIVAGKHEFVYTTPEQLANPEFRDLLRQQMIDLFVVDEAHCVSQWGHDFRPDYLSLSTVIENIGRPPVLALTASATPDVIDDICSQLSIPDAQIVHTGFYRDNLRLSVIPASGEIDKRLELAKVLAKSEGCGIIYAATVRAVEELTESLANKGIVAEGYHGRLSIKLRTDIQDRFMRGDLKVIVATNAFGLGIDKPDIRFVVHFQMPGSLEAFYQEFGRAGRDGKPADCTLLYDPEDRKLQRFFKGGKYPDALDLINAHHTLMRFVDRDDAPTLAEIQSVSPLPRVRLKVCLAMFEKRGIVRAEPGGRLKLRRPDLTSDDFERESRAYRDRHEQDLIRLERMTAYAEGFGCKWKALLEYFGNGEESHDRCGHCCRCESATRVTC